MGQKQEEGGHWKGIHGPGHKINCEVRPDMEKSGVLRHQWNSFQCIEKVEDMISKAIRQQEDLWNMLLIHSPENPPPQEPDHDNHPTDHEELYSEPEANTISPHVVRAMKVKVENSMDWCHLALCRLKEIISYNTLSRENVNASPSISPRLNVPLSTEPLFSGREWSQGSGFFSFNEAVAQTCDGGEQQFPDDAQGHRFPRSLPSLGLEYNPDHWNYMLTDSAQAQLPFDLQAHDSGAAAPIEALNQSSSSCQLDHHGADMNVGLSEQTNSCRGGLRPRSSCGPKRDREEADEKDTTVSVVFQELKPGDDTKKGIPDDGHRGWKKYGNKTIQNSNFCRGYYKCSMKECGAKKMVQPTDKNPSIFEVTYVGSHTCSSTSTSRRRHRSRSSATTAPKSTATTPRKTPGSPQDLTTTIPGANATTDILVQTKIARLIKNQVPSGGAASAVSSTISSTPSSAISSSPSPIISSNLSPNISSISSEPDHPLFTPDHPVSGSAVDDHHPPSMVDHPSLAQSGSELMGAEMDVRRVEVHVEDDIVYLGQMSLRDEIGFHSDSLLWQDILSSRDPGMWTFDGPTTPS